MCVCLSMACENSLVAVRAKLWEEPCQEGGHDGVEGWGKMRLSLVR